MEQLFDGPGRRVLANARRAMEANRNKVSGDLGGPNELEAPTSERRREETSQPAGADRAGGATRMGKESGRPDYGFRAHSRVEVGPAGRPSRDEQASEEDRATVVTLSTFRKQVGERRSGARGRTGAVVLPFSVRSMTWEW
jgi:hypothetical protein